MEDKEFFYFGVKKAFKPFAYDIVICSRLL